MLVIAMLLLLVAFIAGRRRGSSRRIAAPGWRRSLAVAVVAPIATFLVYLPAIGMPGRADCSTKASCLGFIFITGYGAGDRPAARASALYRERDAQARSASACSFELETQHARASRRSTRGCKLLHAQIEPHFLFNTLANVQALVESGSPQARPVLRSLIAYLRAAMPRLHEPAPRRSAPSSRWCAPTSS